MIAFVCAMPCEVDALVDVMEHVKKTTILHMDVFEGELSKRACVVALSGVGKVNAAMSSTLLIGHYDVKTLINVGVAGGLRESQNPFDIVISNHVIQHDYDTSYIDGDSGLGLSYPCDERLINVCSKILKNADVPYFVGDTASGDQFVTKQAYLARIQTLFPQCVSTEMEAGAIAQVCSNAKVPCLIIRSLSDVTVREGNELEFETFAAAASKKAAWLAQELLKEL